MSATRAGSRGGSCTGEVTVTSGHGNNMPPPVQTETSEVPWETLIL